MATKISQLGFGSMTRGYAFICVGAELVTTIWAINAGSNQFQYQTHHKYNGPASRSRRTDVPGPNNASGFVSGSDSVKVTDWILADTNLGCNLVVAKYRMSFAGVGPDHIHKNTIFARLSPIAKATTSKGRIRVAALAR